MVAALTLYLLPWTVAGGTVKQHPAGGADDPSLKGTRISKYLTEKWAQSHEPPCRRPRESGGPGLALRSRALDSRFRENDGRCVGAYRNFRSASKFWPAVAIRSFPRYAGVTWPNFEADVVHTRARWFLPRAILMVNLATIFACAVPPAPPRNPFIGTWATSDNERITIRQDTVVQHPSNGQNTPLDNQACNGTFSFSYTVENRDVLTGLLPRQPDLDKSLSTLLSAPTYRVALLRCDRGDHTYVLLNDHELVAIYRDDDIGVVQRLARR
jgi:hypothetical protein